MIRIGIECESIEQDSWGIARIINKLLEDIARRPELQKEFKFFLYFKSKIPNYPFLNNPIFVKRLVRVPLVPKTWLPISFSLYYYILLPIRLWFERLDVMYFTNYMLPPLVFTKSIVFLTHDAYYESRSKNIPLRYRLAYRIFSTWAAKRATQIMSISEFSKQELQNVYGINSDRITVNYLGVDVPNRSRAASHHARDYILFVGQAFPRRHLKESLLAFEKIAPHFPNLDFIVVGPDKYSPLIIQTLIKEINARLGSERIIHKERVRDDELAQYYSNAKALMYISTKEAFGLPPLEALAYGTYPIIADNPLSREIFGESAFMVKEPESVFQIAEVTVAALTDSARQYRITANKDEVLNKFTWQAHTDRFLKLVQSMAHG